MIQSAWRSGRLSADSAACMLCGINTVSALQKSTVTYTTKELITKQHD